MAVVINSNVSALAAIRQLDKATSDLGGSLERLSSGMRINKASDDAAGLAVSENLKVDAAVANRGRLNVNDGISILQIADSALDQISDMLARKAELAEQASNGSFTQAQREALDLEYQALDKEIKRIVDTTEFNGLKILGGSLNEEATFEQLTNTTGGTTNGGTTYVATSADGLIVTYYDDSQGALVQLNTITNESTIITTEIGVNNKIVSDSGGQTIVFESTGDITGENASGFMQLFKYDAATGTIIQLTDSIAGTGQFNDFILSADGSTLAFSGTTIYTQGGTKDDATTLVGRGGLNVLDLNSGTFTYANNVGNTPGTLNNLAISADGSYVAFGSKKNIAGNNADLNEELYYVDLSADTLEITQITNTTGTDASTSNLFITTEGKVYFSTYLNIDGLNTVGASNLFEYDINTDSFSMITENTATGSNNEIQDLTVNTDGSSLTFVTRATLDSDLESGDLGYYKYDFLTGELNAMAIYPALGAAGKEAYSADGNTYYIMAASNKTGENADGNVELFKVTLAPSSFSIDIETGSGELGKILSEIDAINGGVVGLGSHTLISQSSAKGALESTKYNIDKIGQIQGVIGAGLSRLETANAVISSTAIELTSANSRIVDIDVAEETANLVKNQIRQQAAAAILAQANLQPEIATKLLQFPSN